MADDRSPATAWRETIRGLGNEARTGRWVLGVGMLVGMSPFLLLLATAAQDSAVRMGFTVLVRSGEFGLMIGAGLVFLSAPVLVALGTASLYRSLRRQWLRGHLRSLSPEALPPLLLPLLADRQRDTRKLVEPLVRELGIRTEVTPSAAPTGDTSLVTPADRQV